VNIAQYFEDLEITEPDYKKVPKVGYPSLFRLLTAIAVQGKADNVPPNLAGDTMQAILDGQPLPYTLLQAAVRRCRAEREVGYVRAALLKAILNRRLRNTNPSQTHFFTVALDPNNTNPGYRLGLLFATLEKIQQEAMGKSINATIRDRYYGAASSTPSTVFAQLMRLKNHHLSKLENAGRRENFEKLLAEVIGGYSDYQFKKQLALPDQGAFAIGYYHQMQALYKYNGKDLIQFFKTGIEPTNIVDEPQS
jgi:CRISPR-associated protein Csd1